MGCDIHMWVERLESDGLWHLVPDAKVFKGRNYRLFGWLAGVRGDGPPIAEPRGWPSDMSSELRAFLGPDHEGPDYQVADKRLGMPGDHTPSYLTIAEIQQAFSNLPLGSATERKNSFGSWLDYQPEICQTAFTEFRWDDCLYWQHLAQGDATKVRLVFNFYS